MRIVTHTDLDGLISAYLICKQFGIEDPKVVTVEPGEVQDGSIKFYKDDFVCDLPQPRDEKKNPIKVKLWFDHHIDSDLKLKQEGKYVAEEKSCAQVIVDYFKMKVNKDMIKHVNRIDSADFTLENMDKEDTGFYISMALKTKDSEMDFEFFRYVLKVLIDKGYEYIQKDKVIMFRAEAKIKKLKESRKKIKKLLKIIGDIGILDMTNEPNSKDFDRFYPFVLKPDIKYLIRLQRGPFGKVRVSLSRNVFHRDKTSVSVQELAKLFGGGGHKGAGGFDSTFEDADRDVETLLEELNDAIRED